MLRVLAVSRGRRYPTARQRRAHLRWLVQQVRKRDRARYHRFIHVAGWTVKEFVGSFWRRR